MTARRALSLVEAAHSLDDSAELLAWQLASDGRYMTAQHVSLMRLTHPCNAREGMCIIYDIALRYQLVPRTDIVADDDDDLPF